MRRFTLTHEFNVSLETFWNLNFDREMNEAMFRQGLGFPDYTVQEFRDTDTEIFRRTVATPKMEHPRGGAEGHRVELATPKRRASTRPPRRAPSRAFRAPWPTSSPPTA